MLNIFSSTPLEGALSGFAAGFRRAAVAAVVATTTLSFGGAASAATLHKNLKFGAWSGGVYVSDKTGAFSHCVVSAKYKSGITLLFSITKGQRWKIGFSKKGWELTPGEKYPVLYQVDKGEVNKGQALASGKRLAVVSLPAENTLFNRMRRGRTLKVKAGDDILAFNLTGTSKMLRRLLDCSIQHENLVVDLPSASNQSSEPKKNPFASKKQAPRKSAGSAPKGIAPEYREEAVRWLKANFANGGLDYSVVRNEGKARKMYKRHAVIWRITNTKSTIGTLRIFPRSTPSKMENNVLAHEAKNCKGDFASKFFQDDGVSAKRIGRLMTTCRGKDGVNWNVYYAFAERTAGGTYLVTVMSNRDNSESVIATGERVTGIMQTGPAPAAELPAGSQDDDLPIREEGETVRF